MQGWINQTTGEIRDANAKNAPIGTFKGTDGKMYTKYADGTWGPSMWGRVSDVGTTKSTLAPLNYSNPSPSIPTSNNSGGIGLTHDQIIAKGFDENNLPAGYYRSDIKSGPATTAPTANDFLTSIKDELTKQMDEMSKRTTDFNTQNPFSFDEAQAKASAQERYNPYYDAELKDFLTGISRQRQSTEGEKQLLIDTNRIQTGQDAKALDSVIKSSEEGYAGNGLFFSGARENATGNAQIAGQDQATNRTNQFNYNIGQNTRTLAGLDTTSNTGVRQLNAAKTTDIQTEIERQKAEEQARWQTERAQYVGYPYTSSITGGLNDFVTQAFQ